MVDIDLKPKHEMAVPGLGVFIAPKGVARLFSLTDYAKCPQFHEPEPQISLFDEPKPQRLLYPIIRPNVYKSPRYCTVFTQKTMAKNVRTAVKITLEP